MKKVTRYLIVLCFFVGVIATSYASSQSQLSQGIKDLDSKGKKCYVIGIFHLMHTCDSSVADEQIKNVANDINYQCTFVTNIEMMNTKSNKKYTFELKPVTGSSISYYREPKLTKNTEETYLIEEVPAGDYTFTTVTSRIMISKPGYQDYRAILFNLPVSKLANKEVNFTTQEKQIAYIGDFEFELRTYVCLNNATGLYCFKDYTLNINDNFEDVKAKLAEAATDDKLKAKLDQYEIVSTLE